MSLFSNMFGKEKTSEPKFQWTQLETIDQLDDIVHQSAQRPVIIFKHSTRCSISRMALRQFESEFDLQDKVTPYFLDLLAYREISNAVTNRFNVVHQSPQLLLIRDGMSVYDASHGDIDAEKLKSEI